MTDQPLPIHSTICFCLLVKGGFLLEKISGGDNKSLFLNNRLLFLLFFLLLFKFKRGQQSFRGSKSGLGEVAPPGSRL